MRRKQQKSAVQQHQGAEPEVAEMCIFHSISQKDIPSLLQAVSAGKPYVGEQDSIMAYQLWQLLTFSTNLLRLPNLRQLGIISETLSMFHKSFSLKCEGSKLKNGIEKDLSSRLSRFFDTHKVPKKLYVNLNQNSISK